MKKLNKNTYKEIRNWMMHHARLLEMSLWKYYFEDGSKEDVVNILQTYQNEDGGFGQALEADNWNPMSTPITTYEAIMTLEHIGYEDMNAPIYQGIKKYISSGQGRHDHGWKFCIESNDGYPHAPWWEYNEEVAVKSGNCVTAGLCVFIIKHMSDDQKEYRQALEYIKHIVEKIELEEQSELMVKAYLTLLTVEDILKGEGIELESKKERISELVMQTIEHDTSKWPYYTTRPSCYISGPNSPYYEANKEIVQQELDYLIDTKPEGDVWPITWSWFNTQDKYPKEFAVSEVWWKGVRVIEALRLLEAYGRIEK